MIMVMKLLSLVCGFLCIRTQYVHCVLLVFHF